MTTQEIKRKLTQDATLLIEINKRKEILIYILGKKIRAFVKITSIFLVYLKY